MREVRERLAGGPPPRLLVPAALWWRNPVLVSTLGVCSALAVTARLLPALVMGAALTAVAASSCFAVSLMRRVIPRRLRMMAQVAVIGTLVITVDSLLRAFWFEMSRELGPYVALIITNCIVMGRCESFAMRHRPLPSALDGAAAGLGYALVLALIGAVRELASTGGVLGVRVLPEGYQPCLIAAGASGAFFVAGLLVWMARAVSPASGWAKAGAGRAAEPPGGGVG